MDSLPQGTARTASKISVLLIAFLVPLVFSIRLEDGFELPQTFCALAAAAFLYLAGVRRDWGSSFQSDRFLYLSYFGFLVSGIVSFARLSREGYFWFPTQNYLWALSAVLFLAPVGGGLEKRRFVAFLVGSGVLGSLYSFAQALGMDLGGWDTHFGGRSFSTLGNPIFWAGHLLVLLPLALYLALSSGKKVWRGAWFGAFLLLAASLLTTQTRGAWLGFLGEAALLVFFGRGKRGFWKGTVLCVLGFLLAVLAVPSLENRALSIFRIHNRDAQGRYFLWEVAREGWLEKKWMGQGPGGYAHHFQRIQSRLSQTEPYRPYWTAYHAHEEYLELLCERGLAGVLGGALFLGGLLRRRLGAAARKTAFTLPQAELAVLAGIGIDSFFNFPLSIVPTACALALLFNPHWDEAPGEGRAGLLSGILQASFGVFLAFTCGWAALTTAQNARLHAAMDRVDSRQFGEALALLGFDPEVPFFHYLDPRPLKEEALALDGLGEWEGAARMLEQETRFFPDDADAYATLCMLYGKMKEWGPAVQAGRRALEIAPYHEQALNNLAVAFYLQGDKKRAVEFLSKLEAAQEAWGEPGKAKATRQKIRSLS